MRLHCSRSARLLASVAVVLTAATGCSSLSSNDRSDSIAPTARSEAEWRREAPALAERYRANPRNPEAAIQYAQALRATAQRSQAVAVLEQASVQNPHHSALLGAYGRALADIGHHQQALEVLKRAHTPDQPDWRILSVQGAVLDQLGRHEEARKHYSAALRIVPEEPSVLSNLGLSYALAKDLTTAEATLRRASARAGNDKRVRQNLALVIGLQGRFSEAEGIARADLPPEEAAENVAYLRQMLAQHEDSKKPDRAADSKKPDRPPATRAASRSEKPTRATSLVSPPARE
jgi:Flp pilus assembly protein TadD